MLDAPTTEEALSKGTTVVIQSKYSGCY